MSRTAIGKYVDLKLIGQGGMAEVYIGTDPTLNRKVAIKLILPHFSDNSDFEARFQREAETIAGLRHSNIIQIHEYSIEDGPPFMVMEYISGGSLAETLLKYKAQDRTMSLEEIATLLDQIASGLGYAHKRGLIHRDIKPANILISDDGDPIIADFGIVKLLDEAAMLTMTGGVVGSPRYIPPEQVSQLGVDKRGDIYSLGIVLYQMVTGEVPFDGDMISVLMQHVNNPPENPITINPDLPEGVANTILKALEKSPDDRFDSVGDMAKAFRKGISETEPSKTPAVKKASLPPKPLASAAKTLAEPNRKKEKTSSKSNNKLIGTVIGLVTIVAVAYLAFTGGFGGAAEDTAENTPVSEDIQAPENTSIPGDTEPASIPVESQDANGEGVITYSFDGSVYRLKAQEGAEPENISEALDQFSTGEDQRLNISPDGEWLIVETERFDPECSDWACLAIIPADLSVGETIRANAEVVHVEGGISAIASGGNLVIYSNNDGPHPVDLWAITREAGNWGAPILLTGESPFGFNYQPSISDDGSKLVFNCGPESYADEGSAICEVDSDGANFHVVLTPADAPPGYPTTGAFTGPDYAPDGSIVFEGDWRGEQIWRLPVGASEPELVTTAFGNDNSPCVLPDGRIISLWLNRPEGDGIHELKAMTLDGSSYMMILLDADVADVGVGCGASID